MEEDWVSWLKEAKIPAEAAIKYAGIFEAHSIARDHLPLLDHALLSEMGVNSVGHRLDILRHANAQPSLIHQITKAVTFLNQKVPGPPPTHGIILGSGLSDMLKRIENQIVIPYEDIPFFEVTTAHSHVGELIVGDLEGKKIVTMRGRHHYYEGYSTADSCFPVRVLKVWGIKMLMIASACGSLKKEIPPGSVVFVDQHISLLPNPLRGPNEDSLGVRWPHGKEPYSKRLIEYGMKFAAEMNLQVERGTYMGISGPSGSTRAELNAWTILGCGMQPAQ